MTRGRRLALATVSVVIALVALGLWIWNFDVSAGEVGDLFRRLRWWAVLPLAALLAGHVALSSRRWQLIEEGLGGERPRFGPAYATGAFALGLGTFLPAPVVNILCRSLANRYAGASGLRGALSGSLDQVADFAVVLLFAIPAAAALHRHDLGLYFWGAGVAALFGLAVLASIAAATKRGMLRFRWNWWARVKPLFDRGFLVRLYGLSILRLVNLTLMTLLIQAATGAASAPAVIVGVPIVTVAISLAMLPGAIGVSEWSFSGVFSAFAIPKSDIVIFVLANRILLTGLSLVLAGGMLVVTVLALRRGRAARSGNAVEDASSA